MANRRALVAGTTSVFAEINGSGDTLEVTNGGLISSSGSLLLAGFNNVVEVLAGDTLDVDAIDSSGAMNIGVTNATAINIGSGGIGGVVTTIKGDLAVDGDESITGQSTFTGDATFEGNITIGDTPGDTVDFGGGGGVTATGNPLWDFGTGQVDFGGNVDANSGLDVTGILTVGGIAIAQSGDALLLGGTGTTDAPAAVSLTTAERDALTPVNGMFIWNETSSNFQWYDGATWQSVPTSASAGGWTDDGTVVRLTTSTDNVAIGVAAMLGTETLRVVGDVGIQGDIDLESGGARTISVRPSPDDTNGYALSMSAGDGGAAIGSPAGIDGGVTSLSGGDGGAGSVGTQGGNGGDVAVTGGAAGPSGGVGAGLLGSVNIGVTSTNQVTIGGAAVTVVNMPDASISGFLVQEGANGYIKAITTNGSEAIELGNTNTNPALTQLGSGQVSFAGNVDAAAGLDVTTAALTAAAGVTVTGGAIDLDPTGTFALDMDATFTATVTVADDLASAFLLTEAANNYIKVDTTNGSEKLTFGNDVNIPSYEFAGTGTVSLSGTGQKLALANDGFIGIDSRATDPTTGSTEGALYTKTVSSEVHLFYREESSGLVHQITPQQTANSEYSGTAGEALAVGQLANISWDLANTEPRVYLTDADSTGTLSNAVGIVTLAAGAAGNATTVQLTGESPVIPDAYWDAAGGVPAANQVGQAVYMSQDTGDLTTALPAGNVTVQQIGNLSVGGTGACRIIINVMVQLKKAA